MAYDDSRFRGEPGFREEPDFRSATGLADGRDDSAYAPGSYSLLGGQSSESTLTLGSTPSPVQLDNVFDDPRHGEPGRDRMAVHALWELVLLLGAAATVYLLRESNPDMLRGAGLRDLFVTTAALGLVTVGMALSLRAAAPNLALGPVTYGAALFFADNSHRGLLPDAGVTALLGLGVGLVIAVVVTGLHVPGWAASLAAAFGVIVWIQRHTDTVDVVGGAYRPATHAMYWFIGFAALSLLGGLLGLFKPIRRATGRFRPVADPARRRGTAAAMLTALSIVGSTLLAAVAGVLIALHVRTVSPTENGLALTGLALGAALIGGTSVFGRRGGVFGTLFAVAITSLVLTYAEARDLRLSTLGFAAALIGVGLVVSRLIETFGRPRSAGDADRDAAWARNRTTDDDWTTRGGTGWTAEPASAAAEESWRTEERWGSR